MPRPVCKRCRRPQGHCLCRLIPSLASRTRVLVLQHPSEAGYALNTARLAVLGLQQAQLWVGERFDGLAERLETPGLSAALLFPGPEARVLGEPASDWSVDAERLLIVPDGTWRKARKLLYLNPELAALPRLTLPGGLVSRYRLRKAPAPGALSTLEAIAEALNRLETTTRFDALRAPFEALIEGQIAAMGRDTFRRNHEREAT